MRRLRVVSLVLVAAAAMGQPVRADRIPKCLFGPGALPIETLPRKPHGAAIPIDTIVVVMQENRSFDHYLGQLHFQGQKKVRALPRNASNPDPTNPGAAPIRPFHKTEYCESADLDHSWDGTHHEWNGGRMDGFTTANQNASVDPTGSRTMGYYDSSDLPFYYALYSTFAMGDRYFSSVLSQTFPNRFFLLAATSFGHIANDFPIGDPVNDFTQRTIFNLLDEAGITWKVYFSQIPFADEFSYVRNHVPGNVVTIDQYFTDAQTGTLPQVSFVDPIFIDQANLENDEHPPSNVQIGQEYVARVVNGLLQGPQWARSAIFLTYDEHGGFYDHVPPPRACVPDNILPMIDSTNVEATFNRYGIRVPFAVVSPYARRHYVSHKVYDHTSILRFIETRFDLPALTRRDANADPALRLFKFSKPSFLEPPMLPVAVIDAAHQNSNACLNAPPPTGL
jgi:phospholipase C